MVAPSLDRLLRPKTVAVLGGGWAEAVIQTSLEMQFDGEIWPVHPRHGKVAGLKAYRDIADLPSPPDAVFVGINRFATIESVERLSAMGAGGVVAFASGFAEVDDGADLQRQLVAAAGTMPVLGPNCYGIINYLDGAVLWPDIHGGSRVESGVAIITQSSNLSINLTMQKGGLPIAYMLTLGNQAMVGMDGLIRAVTNDDRVTAIGLHIEGIRDVAAFAEAVAFARSRGKPVVAIKAGASDAARTMTMSHTASLAGAHHVVSAFLEASGVGQASSIEAWIQALALLHCFGPIEAADLMTLSCSGGEASLIADAAQRQGIAMPLLDQATIARIKATCNPLVTVSNPFDYHTFDWGDREQLEATFTAAMTADVAIHGLILDYPREGLGRVEDWDKAAEAWQAARDTTGSKAVVLATLPECMPENVAKRLIAEKIAPLKGLDAALEALAIAHKASLDRVSFMPQGIESISGEPVLFTEIDAKSLLAGAGVSVPQGGIMTSLDDALQFAENRTVVMKATAAHKTEEDGVRLDLRTPDDIRDAWQDLAPKGDVLVEEMVTDAVAEVIVGIARDPQFGLYLVIGAGGIMTEILEDTATLMLPASRDDVRSALGGLKISALLEGFRGADAGDIDALIDLVMAVQKFAISRQDSVVELDINPALVLSQGQGVVAVDALLRGAK
jgi:acyl-CoA synthetase (NDP forming)